MTADPRRDAAPTTEAGRALLGLTGYFPFETGEDFGRRKHRVADAILAIEAEAAAAASSAAVAALLDDLAAKVAALPLTGMGHDIPREMVLALIEEQRHG